MRDPGELISAYFDDCLEAGELAELRTWLVAEPENLGRFVRESVIHSRLHDILLQHDMRGLVFDEVFGDTIDPQRIASLLDEEEASAARRALEEAEEARRLALAAARRQEQLDRKLMRVEEPRVPRALTYASLAVAATLLVMLGRFMAPVLEADRKEAKPTAKSAPHEPAESPMIAQVSKTFDATMRRGNQPILAGAKIQAGSLVVERGVSELTFADGARIVIEGPAELEVVTAQHARVVRGRVVAYVPHQALGFTLRSDAASFIDLGTEFGVEVGAGGLTSVHVFDGEVALVTKQAKTPSRTLQLGVANEVSTDGAVRDVPVDRSFLRRVPASAYELAVLKSRPLVYWKLDEVQPSVAFTSEGRLAVSTVANAGLSSVDNKVQDKKANGPLRAAQFVGEHDGIDVAANAALGLVSQCTCEAWVLPTADPTGPQRIFSTFDRPRSGIAIGIVDGRWYKLPENDLKLQLTVYGDYDCISATPIPADRWVHLAATIDEQGAPTLYVNGDRAERRFRPIGLVGATPESKPAPWMTDSPTPIGRATSGQARIGRNPVGSDGNISPERWQGQISHVAVYDRVLDGEEIFRHFDATRITLTDHQGQRP